VQTQRMMRNVDIPGIYAAMGGPAGSIAGRSNWVCAPSYVISNRARSRSARTTAKPSASCRDPGHHARNPRTSTHYFLVRVAAFRDRRTKLSRRPFATSAATPSTRTSRRSGHSSVQSIRTGAAGRWAPLSAMPGHRGPADSCAQDRGRSGASGAYLTAMFFSNSSGNMRGSGV